MKGANRTDAICDKQFFFFNFQNNFFIGICDFLNFHFLSFSFPID